ncbi:phosphodiester glycosidase family protein [Brevibacillus ginsengisoli]|uniref:phosphodiester glycosidase family protein n=1 Tax=Brevibacillus ginsengisoli TaxID=363854 RepID=UPI003CFB4BB2
MEPRASRTPQTKKKRKRKSFKRTVIMSGIMFLLLTTAFVLSYDARLWLAGSLLVTQHSQWAKYTFVGEDALNKLKKEIAQPEVINSEPVSTVVQTPKPQEVKPAGDVPLVQVEPIEKNISSYHYFKGYVMKVSDPSRVHLVQTVVKKNRGKPRGEWIDEFSERTHALGGINASGFYDPNYMGYASQAAGLVIVDGKLIQDYDPRNGDTAVGIDYSGKLVTGNYTSQQLIKMGIRDAVSFRPQLIVNGKNLFAGKDATSWGIAPRSAIGQTADGTIIMIVIDGRQQHSPGASMKDMADLFEEYGAVNAMALDGGTSAMMIQDNKILTKSCIEDPRGRWIPNAWMVY